MYKSHIHSQSIDENQRDCSQEYIGEVAPEASAGDPVYQIYPELNADDAGNKKDEGQGKTHFRNRRETFFCHGHEGRGKDNSKAGAGGFGVREAEKAEEDRYQQDPAADAEEPSEDADDGADQEGTGYAEAVNAPLVYVELWRRACPGEEGEFLHLVVGGSTH